MTNGPVPQDAYVWQRSWTPAVTNAIQQHAAAFGSLVILGSEVSWKRGRPEIARARIDYASLRSCKTKIGIALRVGPFSGVFSSCDDTAAVLGELAGSLLAEASSNSISVCELQIDFDSAASKLDGYNAWLQAIREKTGATPLIITALPNWLRQPAFKRLIASTDGFVLQVHSLERPKSPEDPFILCDTKTARKAVRRAASFGKPFRVALPTYGYIVAFDHQRKFIGLSADGPELIWPRGALLKEVVAEPEPLAEIMRDWNRKRPSALGGVIWYRLPVAGEALNWSWPTLGAVMEGRNPQANVRAQVRQRTPGLIEVTLVNDGERGADALPGVTVEWQTGRFIAGDGLNGFHLDTRSDGAAHLTAANIRELKPGELRKIGWLRLEQATDSIRLRTF